MCVLHADVRDRFTRAFPKVLATSATEQVTEKSTKLYPTTRKVIRMQHVTVMMTVWLVCALWISPGWAQEANYDEARVPAYKLPELLVDPDGNRIETAADWSNSGRAKWLRVVTDQVYGEQPQERAELTVVASKAKTEGQLTTKQVTLRCSRNGKSVDLHLLVFLPAAAERPVKTFLGLNFNGNHTVTTDPDIPVTKNWVRNDRNKGYVDHRASESSRGTAASRWPVQEIVARGYGVATMYYGDIDPDFHDGFENGVHALFGDQTRTATSWGSIAAWSWGLSRIVDYFEQDPEIDASRICLMGHSRLGKTSLWAGATDERFALVISNNSGCGGAALSRRRFGETVKRINTSFPHWFCDNFKKYNDREDTCPVDQHTLIALIAPRPGADL